MKLTTDLRNEDLTSENKHSSSRKCFKSARLMSFTVNSRLEHRDKRQNNQGSLEEKRPAGVGGGQGEPRWPES